MQPQRNIAIALPLVGEEEWRALRESFETGWLTQGPKVAAFERAFAERHEVAHAIATTSCTTALHLALVALDVGPGDEVILPSFTWVATANAVLYCGATPVLVDIDPATFNLDISAVQSALTSRTKAVIAVHLFGLCADIDALRAILPESVKILEDAACAAGATLNGRSAGSLGDVAAFSLHPRKSITTGEGGMITTGDDSLAVHMSMLRNHGASVSEEQRHVGSRPYILPDFDELGFNYRMTDLQGAVGLVQLGRLDSIIGERQEAAAFYRDNLSDIGWLQLPEAMPNCVHGWQSYVTTVDVDKAPLPRDGIMDRLQAVGVSSRPGTHAVHMLGYYVNRFDFTECDFPVATDRALDTMAIPLHNRMSADDYNYVSEQLHALCG